MFRTMLAAVALASLLAGCGGASHSKKGRPSTAAGFAAAANRVCGETKSHRARIAALRKLQPPAAERDLYEHWLDAERLAVQAADVIEGRRKGSKIDPSVELAIAEGKIDGYAGRLGAHSCVGAPGGRMPS